MNKNIIIGLVALGGLILITNLLPNEPDPETITKDETANLSNLVTNNFPIYPQTKVLNQSETANEDGRTFYSFNLEAKASIKEINEWYRKALSQDGWSIKSDKNVAGYQIIQAEKDNLFTSIQAAGGPASDISIISQQAQIKP
jgi:hypothetical protein